MTNRRTVLSSSLALLAGAMVLALPGCGVAGEQLPDYRYRLTVEVDTPEGLKTGSSVIEVKTATTGRNAIPTPGAVRHRIRGEAVAVDLGASGVLFALLRSDKDSGWASNLMFRLAPDRPDASVEIVNYDSDVQFNARFNAMLAMRNQIELPKTFPDVAHLKDWPARPMLVRFGDIADPKTVERVDPDKLSASFGKGVTLRRITVQLRDDPVTAGIEKRLVWINFYRKSHFDETSTIAEDMTASNLASHMTSGSFSTEFAK